MTSASGKRRTRSAGTSGRSSSSTRLPDSAGVRSGTRLLVIDESLSKRIRAELYRRGRNARTVAEVGLTGLTDPEVLEALHRIDPDCVFISADDAMPVTHADVLQRLQTTVAIVAPLDPSSSLSEPQWEHEIVQRWAHRMEEQPPGTIFRYGLSGGRRWVRRRRTRRLA